MLKIRNVLRAGLARFLPGALGLLAAVLTFDMVRGVPFMGMRAFILSADLSGLVAGYALAVILLRNRMREDAQVHGRRSVIAGVVAAAASYWALMLIGNPWHSWPLLVASVIVTGVVGGVVGTVAVFFPWLTAASKAAPVAAAHASPSKEL